MVAWLVSEQIGIFCIGLLILSRRVRKKNRLTPQRCRLREPSLPVAHTVGAFGRTKHCTNM